MATNRIAGSGYLHSLSDTLAYSTRYLRWRRASVNRHGVHSPFVYSLIEEVFRPSKRLPDPLSKQRHKLLSDTQELEVKDLGAGSRKGNSSTRSVQELARTSLSTKRQANLLSMLIPHLEIKQVLEFGSSLGLSAAYFAKAGAQVISMEGSEALHQHALSMSTKVDYRLGNFDDILPGILQEIPVLDMAYIDGNHREEPTLRYFEQLLSVVHAKSVLTFDDIHWSAEMEAAWEAIKSHEQVTLSLDLFWCGMVFFDPGLSGEHFCLRY